MENVDDNNLPKTDKNNFYFYIFIFSIDEYDILVINPAPEVCTYLNKLIDKYISVQYIFVDMTYLSLSLYSLLSLFYIPTQQLKPLLYID